MNGKTYSETALSIMIDAATQYIEAPNLRDSIISKCHQEIGLLVVGAPPWQRAAINLNPEEVKALASAIHRRRQERGAQAVSG